MPYHSDFYTNRMHTHEDQSSIEELINKEGIKLFFINNFVASEITFFESASLKVDLYFGIHF